MKDYRIEKGMRFKFKSKYSKDYYFGVVDSITTVVANKGVTNFYGDNGVAYRSDEVEWLDELRDQKLKELGI